MNRQTIENILNFLNTNEDKELPNKWFDSIEKLKLIHELETHADGTQYRYNGNLDLNDSTIRKLPNDLYVDKALILENCKQLTKLPNNLYVGGYLDLTNCEHITELPNGLYVRRTLFIYNTPLANKYTDEEIRKIVASKGGTLIGKIYR
jgi:hypothetical protein